MGREIISPLEAFADANALHEGMASQQQENWPLEVLLRAIDRIEQWAELIPCEGIAKAHKCDFLFF